MKKMGMKTGDIVEISNAFFKNDNGMYVVAHSPGDPNWCGSDYSLRKLNKNGSLSTRKYNIAFWPLKAFTNSYWKRAEANDWNSKNATIAVVSGIDKSFIKDYFREKSDENADAAKSCGWRWGKDNDNYKKYVEISDFYKGLADAM